MSSRDIMTAGLLEKKSKIPNPIYTTFPGRKIAICMESHLSTAVTFMVRVYCWDPLW